MAQRTEGTLFCNKQNGHLASCLCHPCAILRFSYDVWIISILKIMFGWPSGLRIESYKHVLCSKHSDATTYTIIIRRHKNGSAWKTNCYWGSAYPGEHNSIFIFWKYNCIIAKSQSSNHVRWPSVPKEHCIVLNGTIILHIAFVTPCLILRFSYDIGIIPCCKSCSDHNLGSA